MLDVETCWNAVLSKDKSQDGRFFFGVITTGVYCRPSCPSRKPLRKNVRFYETAAEAERHGLRPCLRCRPVAAAEPGSHGEGIRSLCDDIRRNCHSGDPLTLETLSRQVGMSPFQLHRRFRAVVGVTPKQYVAACRLESLKGRLRSNKSVTAAIYEAGFGSSSRVYEGADRRLGMTPAEYRIGGKGVSISYVSFKSPLGRMMIGATDRGVCFVQFGDSHHQLLDMLRKEYPAAVLAQMKRPYPKQFGLWIGALVRYMRGERPRLDLPVAVRGTAFQLKVWKYLQTIPDGAVQSYSEVGRAIDHPAAVRAVAGACASNRVAIVIPCHRVIRGDGALGGYRWGLERKRVLLDRERAAQAGTLRR